MQRLWFFLIYFLWLPLASSQSITDGIVIQADQMERNSAKNQIYLEGNVQLIFKGQHVVCQKAVIDLGKNEVTAEGNVIAEGPQVHLEATLAKLNYKNNVGYFENAFVQSGQVVFEGRLIEKVGPEDYIVDEGSFTACTNCAPDWSFSGRKIKARLGGYANISRPVFRIRGVPALVLPILIVPLKSARQTGLLVPNMDYSRSGGLALGDSFFWAISPSQDLTATAMHYEKRGTKGLADYRYMLSEHSKGEFHGALLQDKVFQAERNLPADFNRWFYQYNHYYELPDHFVHRLNWTDISDLSYLREFPRELKGHQLPALENRTSITQNLEKRHMSAEITMFKNLLKTNPTANNDDAVHKFPELRYSLREQRLGADWAPLFRLDMKGVQFSRAAGPGYDMLSDAPTTADWPGGLKPSLDANGSARNDGQWNSVPGRNDLMRTGQRLEVIPQLSMPFQLWKRLEITPMVRFHEQQYRWDTTQQMLDSGFSSTAARRYVETDLFAKTEFNRVYQTESGNRYKHSIEPEVTYSAVPWMRQPNHPFFGNYAGQRYQRTFEPIADSDLNNDNRIQFDYADRVFEKRLVDFGITQYLVRKNVVNGSGTYDNLVRFRVSQSYDIREASETSRTPQPWSWVNALLDVRLNHLQVVTASQYNPYARIANTVSRVRLVNDRMDYAEVGYSRSVLLDNNNAVIDNSATEYLTTGVGFTSRYLNLAAQMDYSVITKSVRAWKYIAQFLTPGQCWGIRLIQEQPIGAEPQFHISFEFDFGGNEKKPKLPPRLM